MNRESNGNETQGSLCAGAAGVRRCARVVHGELVEAQAGGGRDLGGFRAGQPIVLGAKGHAARAALSARSNVPGEALARDARGDLRRGRRHPQGLAAVRPVGGRRALGGEQTPALHPARLRAWIHHADGRRRGPVQGGQLLRAGVRRQHPLERSRHRRRLAHRSRHPVGQGYEGPDAQGARGDVAELRVSGVNGRGIALSVIMLIC